MFQNLRNLKKLRLDKNRIETITSVRFGEMSRLEELFICKFVLFFAIVPLIAFFIDDNQIGALTQENFKNLRSLKRLNLSINEIEIVATNTFEDLTSLEELSLGKFNDYLFISIIDSISSLNWW